MVCWLFSGHGDVAVSSVACRVMKVVLEDK